MKWVKKLISEWNDDPLKNILHKLHDRIISLEGQVETLRENLAETRDHVVELERINRSGPFRPWDGQG